MTIFLGSDLFSVTSYWYVGIYRVILHFLVEKEGGVIQYLLSPLKPRDTGCGNWCLFFSSIWWGGQEFEICSGKALGRGRGKWALVIIITVLCVWTGPYIHLHDLIWSSHNSRKRHEHLHFRNEAPKVKRIFIKHSWCNRCEWTLTLLMAGAHIHCLPRRGGEKCSFVSCWLSVWNLILQVSV